MKECKHNLTIDWELPCGCRLTMGLHMIEDDQYPVAFDDLPSQAEKLVWWLKDRAPKHKCELVSTDNPNGIQK